MSKISEIVFCPYLKNQKQKQKLVFYNEDACKEYSKRASKKYGHKLYLYYCDECKGWHLTKMSEKEYKRQFK